MQANHSSHLQVGDTVVLNSNPKEYDVLCGVFQEKGWEVPLPDQELLVTAIDVQYQDLIIVNLQVPLFLVQIQGWEELGWIHERFFVKTTP